MYQKMKNLTTFFNICLILSFGLFVIIFNNQRLTTRYLHSKPERHANIPLENQTLKDLKHDQTTESVPTTRSKSHEKTTPKDIPLQCRDVDNPEALDVKDDFKEDFLDTRQIFDNIQSCSKQSVKLLSFVTQRQGPRKDSKGQLFKVPNVVHRIRFSNKSFFDFEVYMSYLSVEKFLKPDFVFLHGDDIPSGKWWDKIITEVPNLYYVYRRRPTSIGGVNISFIHHTSDITRLQVLAENGGIYLDNDVLVLKSFDPLRPFDFSLGRETKTAVQIGIIVSTKRAKLVNIWLETYHNFKGDSFGHNSVLMAHKLVELFPHLVHLEERSMFHPNWQQFAFMYGGKPYDWSENYSVHFYTENSAHHFPKDPEQLKGYNCTAGEVMRYVYYGTKELLSNKTFHD